MSWYHRLSSLLSPKPVEARMLCPYCLEPVTFGEVRGEAATLSDEEDGSSKQIQRPSGTPSNDESKKGSTESEFPRGPVHYRCPMPKCRQFVPVMYVKGYDQFPPVVASAVGFSKHGKTVFFGSLMHALRSARLHERWPDLFTLALDDPSLATVLANMRMLDCGDLPSPTPNNFPRPTLLRIGNVPTLPDCTLTVYDLSGESFKEAQRIQSFGRFVARARTVLFLASIPQLMDEHAQYGQALDHLLGAYIVGVQELGGDTREQNLVVVYTKADILAKHLDGWKALQEYVRSPPFSGLEAMEQYRASLLGTSMKLHEFTMNGLKAGNFLATARNNFRSVSFTIISSLGAAPNAKTNRLDLQIAPIRVLDPLLMLMAGGPMDEGNGHSVNRRTGGSGQMIEKIRQLFE